MRASGKFLTKINGKSSRSARRAQRYILSLGYEKGNCYPTQMLIFLFLSQFSWSQSAFHSSNSAGVLEGRWAQPCQLQTVREETFAGTSATLLENYYYKTDCSQALMSIRNTGTYTSTDDQLDFTFAQITISLKDIMMVEDFNSRAVCGVADWQLYQERDVTGLECALITGAKPMKISKAGSQRFGIYKVQGDLLYFGRLEPGRDALSPEKRPTTLDPRYYVKQL